MKKITAHRFAIVTAAATFVLLLVGGLVNPTGSSLACPDWPLCHGTAFPQMTNGVQFEHTHRLVAGAVAVMTLVLTALLVLERRWRMGALATAMVLTQAVLGGLTVLLKLPPEISIGHLALSMAFFAYVIFVAVRTRPGESKPFVVPPGARVWLLTATVAVYLQIVLGAVVRHLHAALACADDLPLCFGQLWPSSSPVMQVHMAHRIFAVVTGVLVLIAVIRALPHLPRGTWARWLALAVPTLVVAQITLGVLTVLSMKALVVVEAHLGGGVLMLASLWLLSLHTAARPAEARVQPLVAAEATR
jgi:heme A synthase